MKTVRRYFAAELRPDQEQSWRAEDGIFVKFSEMEKLAPLDISDAIALAERQRQEIAELKAEVHKYKSYYFARFGKLKEDT